MGKEEFKNPHPELPVREPILKLGKMITDRVPIKLGFEKLTADSPEYWGLAPICTDEQANIALKMGVRKPKTLKQMVQITGMDEKELEKQLEQMSFNGLSNIGSQTLRIADSNSSTRVPAGTQPESTCNCATRL